MLHCCKASSNNENAILHIKKNDNMNNKYLSIFLSFGFVLCSYAQNKVYTTRILNDKIKTLQIKTNDDNYLLPVIELNSTDYVRIRFDEMSHEAHSYSYTLIHCNADWTPSGLSTTEFLSGFSTGEITNFTPSQLTTFLYTHYTFDIPNSDISPKISGNYVILIYEDNQQDKPIAQACFSVVEPKVVITGKVRANTDSELYGKMQQLDFDIQLKGYNVRDVNNELKVSVRQNNRTDNQCTSLQPTYIQGQTLSYINNKKLIFEGGNEYHTFDISSVYSASKGVDRIEYKQPHYEAILTPDKIETSKSYAHQFDANGRFIVNFQEMSNDVNIEGDYMYVHFQLPVKSPFLAGLVYLGGEFNYNLMDEKSKLEYDFTNNVYYKTLLMKQGGYNYQYWFRSKGTNQATTERTDGSYWQTSNEYSIYVYHHAFGERYDKLVGVKVVDSTAL